MYGFNEICIPSLPTSVAASVHLTLSMKVGASMHVTWTASWPTVQASRTQRDDRKTYDGDGDGDGDGEIGWF